MTQYTHKVKYQRLWLKKREVQPRVVVNYLGSDQCFHSFYEDDPNIVKLKKPKVT